jgi:hypothetical protein
LEKDLLRLRLEKERPPRSRFSEDRLGEVPGDCCGVEPVIYVKHSKIFF